MVARIFFVFAVAPSYPTFVVLGIPLGFASACFQSLDTVAVQQATANKGDVVVAGIPGEEATVKTFVPNDGRVVLLPANSSMQPLEFPADEVTIYGRVVSVLRRV